MTHQWLAAIQEILLILARSNTDLEQKRSIVLLSNLAFQMARMIQPLAKIEVKTFVSQETMVAALVKIIRNQEAVAVKSDTAGGNTFSLTIIWKTEVQGLVSRAVPDNYLEELAQDLRDLD